MTLGACNYFLGSPALMLCYALHEHVTGTRKLKAIRSYGIDQRDPSHAQQRAAWAFWLGVAHHMGIEFEGTAFDFSSEPEKDAGLVGRREKIGQVILQMQEQAQHNKQRAAEAAGG
jgi:hypothetical protein